MKMLNIAYYTFIRILRDRKSMALMLLMPVMLILILGTALNSAFEVSNIEKTKVYYINNDKGDIAKSFEAVIKSKEIKEMLEFIKTDEKETALNDVKTGKAAALIMIDSGVTDNIYSGESAEITVFEDANSYYGPLVVENFVKSFANGINAGIATQMLDNPNVTYGQKNMIDNKPVSASGKIPKAMDYYAVTMLVLIIMYGSLYGLFGFGDDYLGSMRTRLLSSPVNLFSHLSGKLIGTISSVFAQAFVLILFTKYVYKANWGTNVFEIILITLVLCIFTTAIGIMLVILIKNKDAAGALMQTIIPVMTFISGGYFKIITDNKVYNTIKMFMPSNLGQTAYFNSIYGDTPDQTYFCLAVLGIMIAIIIAVSSVVGRRRLR